MKARGSAAAVAALAGTLACLAGSAVAAPPRPVDLQVTGGEDAWHSDNRFELRWTNPPSNGPALAATHYRIRDPEGSTIEETRIAWVSDGIAGVTPPKVPGAYSAEVWLEDAAGTQGPAATARLRFDDVRPAAIEPRPVPEWIGRTAFPLRVRLSHPLGPPPMAGIRGYAVTIDTAPSGSPCVAADRCRDAETTLGGGVGDDELSIAALPEGISYLHAVAVSGSGMKSATSGRAVLRVDLTDPVTQLTGVPATWTNRAVWLTASAADDGSGMEVAGGGPPPLTAIQVDGGAPAIASGGRVTAGVIDEGEHRIAYFARDAAGNVNDGGEANGIANRAPRMAWVRIDRTPPSVAFTNSQNPRDPDLLRVRVIDPLSGPDPARGWIGVRPVGSGDDFERIPAAPSRDGELRARWDSDDSPAGNYEFRAVGYDAAGNATATTQRENGGSMALSNPLKVVTTLRVGFRGEVLRRTVPYGRGVLYEGHLTSGTGSPLGDMPVRIVERFADGAQPAARELTVRTGPGGAFSVRGAPGPSRTITADFDGVPTLARSTSQALHLQVRSRVRLRASAGVARIGGGPLVFSGKVEASPGTIPPGGKSVRLQFRLPGLPWTEFRTVQTNRLGRFHYAYRFSDDDSRGVRFQFRAYAPEQDGWPYAPGGSRPVVVRGR